MTAGRPTKLEAFQRDILECLIEEKITKISIFSLLRTLGIKSKGITSIEYDPELEFLIVRQEV